ncbi:DUF2911 domain-containing protein [Flavobacterium algicola]|uniref:DUF2911 domain-containing protein n=1 Tax=Flavobacterium algicola TaxID=556529 RepID=UPI001EFCA620|nr:DUF2911 domain-containing protein [Flavobacterium algicola]MCG9793012.1 DUF2911 domain-containing protein [Flavobacterium algicola]
MKKSTFSVSITALFMLFVCVNLQAQKFKALDASPMDATTFPVDYKISDKAIKVVYSRPQLKDRELSTLAPAGKVWRTGANEAVDVTLYKDIKLGGKMIKAGEYSLFTIPGEKEWTIILSKDINVWGSYSYNEANDVVRVKAPVTAGESLENLSMTFEDNGTLFLGWGTTRVAIPFGK